MAPRILLFESHHLQMLKANLRWVELASHCRRALKADPLDWAWTRELISALSAGNKFDEAEEVKRLYLHGLRQFYEAPASRTQMAQFDAMLTASGAMWGSDPKALADCARKIEDPDWKICTALAEGDVVKAIAWISKEKVLVDNPYTLLALYALAVSTGKGAIADQQLASALELLRTPDKTDRLIARWFADKAQIPGLKQTYQASLGPPERKLLLAALGCRHPSAREEFFRDAKKLNFDHDMWWFPVERIIISIK